MTIYLTSLTYEERATWGDCPVCGARPGKFCVSVSFPGTPQRVANNELLPQTTPGEFDDMGSHVARLVNAPVSIAVVGDYYAGPGI